ncbi:MAG: hypothetical protein PVG93_04470 [Phycisphaerales bacterium]|jgi:hypothetical protein
MKINKNAVKAGHFRVFTTLISFFLAHFTAKSDNLLSNPGFETIPTTYQQAQDYGLALRGNPNGDCSIDYSDPQIPPNQWLSTEPAPISPYIYEDYQVDFLDFAYPTLDRLNCNNLKQMGYTHN